VRVRACMGMVRLRWNATLKLLIFKARVAVDALARQLHIMLE
jgi:hypothetical protein